MEGRTKSERKKVRDIIKDRKKRKKGKVRRKEEGRW